MQNKKNPYLIAGRPSKTVFFYNKKNIKKTGRASPWCNPIAGVCAQVYWVSLFGDRDRCNSGK